MIRNQGIRSNLRWQTQSCRGLCTSLAAWLGARERFGRFLQTVVSAKPWTKRTSHVSSRRTIYWLFAAV